MTRDVVARFLRTGPVHVAAAGRFVAWTRDWSRSRRPDLHDDELVVYDRARRNVAYRVRLKREPRLTGIYSLAVQSDGKVAAQFGREVEIGRSGGKCERPYVAWSSSSPAPRLRVLPERPDVGFSSDLELADNHVMFLRSARRRCSAEVVGSDLIVRSLVSASARVLTHYDFTVDAQIYPGPSFDFDGARAVFSEGARRRATVFVDQVR